MSPLCYPFYITIKGKNIILIWYPNEVGTDVFYTSGNKVFIAYNKEQAEEKLYEINFKMVWSDTDPEINLDIFLNTVSQIKENEYIGIDVCNVIIDTWNFFDDLYKTFADEPVTFKRTNYILDKAYHKFFYGINLQVVTPKNECYHPVFSKKELMELNKLMNNFMRFAEIKLLGA